MKRDADNFLDNWAMNSTKPLLITGPAGTGKTYTIESFLERFGKPVIRIDCRDKNLTQIFRPEYNGEQLVLSMDVVFDTTIGSGYLVFLDNIQYAPEVLACLPALSRYHGYMHVIAAGRPEFTVKNLDSFEVCPLLPFSFPEFLRAYSSRLYRAYLGSSCMDTSFHERYLNVYHQYLLVGGMPESINEWIKSKDPDRVDDVQQDLLSRIMDELCFHGKNYGSRCKEILMSIPSQLETKQQKFMFSRVSKNRQARSYRQPLNDLIKKGYILPVCADDQSGMVPFFFDVGLFRSMSGIDGTNILNGKNVVKPLMQNFLIQNCPEVDFSYHPEIHQRQDFLKNGKHCFRYDINALNSDIYTGAPRKDRWIIFTEQEYSYTHKRNNVPIYFAPRLSDFIKAHALS